MEIHEVSKEIFAKINALDGLVKELEKKAAEKANAIGEYEKKMSLVIIQLLNGKEFIVEGNSIICDSKSIVEKIARGICYQEKINMELKEAEYKALIVKIETIQAQLNGYQSIYRHLDKVAN